MEIIRIKKVAEELRISNEYALRLAKKMGFKLHYGKRNAASLLKADAEQLIKDYQPRKKARVASTEEVTFDGFGYFYIIQLLPDEIPDRMKIGYTDSLDQRLSDHRVTNPTLKLVQSWPCKRTWEHAATASITREGCTKIGGEVFQGDMRGFIDRAEAFFVIMPIVDQA